MSVIRQYLEEESQEGREIWLILFVVSASALSLAELLVPFPWWKPGLANVIILILLAVGKNRDALLVSVLRTFITALFRGGLFSPAHILSLSGALLAFVVMLIMTKYSAFSIYGISMAGAFAHSLAQLMVAALLLVSWESLRPLIPLLLGLSLVSGLITAYIAALILNRNGC